MKIKVTFLHSVQGWCVLILFKCDVGYFRKGVLISCFLKKWQYRQYKFQTSFPNICGMCCISNRITLSNMRIRFIALNLCTRQISERGHFFLSSCCHAVSQPFDLLNRRMLFVQRIQLKTFGLVVEALAELHS